MGIRRCLKNILLTGWNWKKFSWSAEMNENLLLQKELVDKHLSARPRQLSLLSFVQLFLWGGHFTFEFKTIDASLCVFARAEHGAFLYFPPLGKKLSAKTAQKVFALLDKHNNGRGVGRIENVQAQELDAFPQSAWRHYLKGYEYCYYRRDLVEFCGPGYKSKRNAYNSFMRHGTFIYSPFAPEMLEDCLRLYDEWAQERRRTHDAVYQQMLLENRDVHRRGMENFQALGLVGRVVIVDGKIRAYTFGYALNETIFCVLFEVADLALKGLPVFIFREFCRDPEVASFPFINVMDDFGLENVAQAKLSFRPALLVPAYNITPR